MGQEFFVFTNALVIQSHLAFFCLSQFFQAILFGNCANIALPAKIVKLKHFPLQEITTRLKNACDLKIISCGENLKDVFPVLVKISVINILDYLRIRSENTLSSLSSITSWLVSFISFVNMP